ncbi:serine hydrolase domain-containing protein [Actinomadura viridis]|uniref:CubicO group peptidase (Beta-lactamase class C family) n=1 Tax=Actinomadura viridis TaxID=58110 RepID=A0A931DJQ7_9ACTN|nr:serine hydrolase domain-containing protein [Actinomadura viridis]MBG6088831.1 CubicO group peptidase (beta-lactamase class C family) [Actinomadura viridis]
MNIEGRVAPGFEGVAEAFRRNFAQRGEIGAAFAVSRGEETLVDLWGGVADSRTRRPWTADTLQIIFSGTKGMVASVLLLLIDRGRLELDVPVARYWPEFAAAGKESVLVRDIVAHTARLPGLDKPVTWREATDGRRMAALLAGQRQSDDPRAGATYHAATFGWLAGELIRRADGRTVGRVFAEEIAAPLGLDLWIGLPENELPRVSRVEQAPGWGASDGTAPPESDPLRTSVFGNPPRYVPESFPWNEPAWQRAEVPSSNGIGTARSIARFYAGLDRVLSPETLALGATPISVRFDPILGTPTAFGVGFQLQTENLALGPPQDAFGHGGSGGSRHGRWPAQGIGFSYAMNLMRDDPADRRGDDLLDALHTALAGEGASV